MANNNNSECLMTSNQWSRPRYDSCALDQHDQTNIKLHSNHIFTPYKWRHKPTVEKICKTDGCKINNDIAYGFETSNKINKENDLFGLNRLQTECHNRDYKHTPESNNNGLLINKNKTYNNCKIHQL